MTEAGARGPGTPSPHLSALQSPSALAPVEELGVAWRPSPTAPYGSPPLATLARRRSSRYCSCARFLHSLYCKKNASHGPLLG